MPTLKTNNEIYHHMKPSSQPQSFLKSLSAMLFLDMSHILKVIIYHLPFKSPPGKLLLCWLYFGHSWSPENILTNVSIILHLLIIMSIQHQYFETGTTALILILFTYHTMRQERVMILHKFQYPKPNWLTLNSLWHFFQITGRHRKNHLKHLSMCHIWHICITMPTILHTENILIPFCDLNILKLWTSSLNSLN